MRIIVVILPDVRAPSRFGIATVAAAMVCSACSGSGNGNSISVIGSFYPLAWAAQATGGFNVSVIDLTPPGVEAHDTNLNAKQVGQIETADVVLILGYLGFQPQVETAARNAEGEVVELTRGLHLRSSNEKGLSADPHVWLDPTLMATMTERIGAALQRADPKRRAELTGTTRTVVKSLDGLDAQFRAGLSSCRFTTFVTTHEAFGYMAEQYGLHQLGIEGLTPEAEPSADQLNAAESAIRDGTAAPAVFYEGTADGKRIGKSVAGDLHVPALPLGTLEFEPTSGTYMTVMRGDLTALEKGLQCR
jgi:zinc transport system substrate-binding protein